MKIFYGWRIVAAGTGMQFLQAALMHQAFGSYVALLVQERGWSKTALSGAAALQSMEAALLGPLLGWMVDRFGARIMIYFGVFCFGGGLIALSQIDTIVGFYGAMLLTAIGSNFAGYFPINVTIIQWFSKRRARALSTVAIGLALGGFVLPIIAWCMQTYGWRMTAMGSGIIAIVIGLPLAGIFRRKPEDYGMTVDGAPPPTPLPANPKPDNAAAGNAGANAASAAQISAPVTQERDFTAREAMRTRAFWLIALGHASALLIVTGINVHAVTHMHHGLGYSLSEAALVIMLMTLSQLGGVVSGWVIGDRYDKRHISAVCMLLHAVGLLSLTFATGPAMLVVFAVAHGSAWGMRGPFMQAIRADYFGRTAIGMIIGVSALVTAIGQISGPLLAGLLADLTGNYHLGFTVLAVAAGLGSLFFLLAKKPPPRTV